MIDPVCSSFHPQHLRDFIVGLSLATVTRVCLSISHHHPLVLSCIILAFRLKPAKDAVEVLVLLNNSNEAGKRRRKLLSQQQIGQSLQLWISSDDFLGQGFRSSG